MKSGERIAVTVVVVIVALVLISGSYSILNGSGSPLSLASGSFTFNPSSGTIDFGSDLLITYNTAYGGTGTVYLWASTVQDFSTYIELGSMTINSGGFTGVSGVGLTQASSSTVDYLVGPPVTYGTTWYFEIVSTSSSSGSVIGSTIGSTIGSSGVTGFVVSAVADLFVVPPLDESFTLTSITGLPSLGPLTSVVSVTWQNNLASTYTGILWFEVYNSASQLILIVATSLTIASTASSTAFISLSTLPAGTYTVNAFAWALSGVPISLTGTITVTTPIS